MSENSPLASSFQTRRSSRRTPASEDGGGGAPPPNRQPVRTRKRGRVGKRSNPRYAQALGYVRRDIHTLVVERALTDPAVVGDLIVALDERGIEHKRGKADYGALVELWSREWLESLGYEVPD